MFHTSQCSGVMCIGDNDRAAKRNSVEKSTASDNKMVTPENIYYIRSCEQ